MKALKNESKEVFYEESLAIGIWFDVGRGSDWGWWLCGW
jgi:hypothetical protein